ncbi:hypothetical protein EAZG_00648 [Escherichia coli TA249]|nr:hypothetical protein EAZG_00648 [Escherichia coli TA249]
MSHAQESQTPTLQQGCLMVAFIFGTNNRINTALCIHSNE